MRCSNCEAETIAGAKFCPNCGSPLPPACPVCGASVGQGARFCAQCGAPLPAQTLQPGLPFPTAAPQPPAPQPAAGYERRLVTILFADIVGFSTLSETIDPEELLEIMSGAYPCLLEPVRQRSGTPVQVMGDGLLAYFGVPRAQEDDPERAIRAGLEIVARIQTYAAQLKLLRGIPAFEVRVGINTGLVVVGKISRDPRLEYSALGDAVNLAARLQQNAPPGGVLVSRETYRHVRGLFTAQPQAPMTVKGRHQAVQTYMIKQAKPRPWRLRTRGVEGVETPMIGREPELLTLQNIYQDAIQGSEPHLVLITGEAGLGKSRLLDEFAAWVDLRPEKVLYFRGRVHANQQSLPYGLFRSLFADRFEILENDSSAEALAKFRHGMHGTLPAEQADLVGQLVGFDFSFSQAVRRLLGSPSFAQMATLYLVDYFRRLIARPTLILLEDLHWADDSSLDLVARLVSELQRESRSHLVIACAARPQLFERRPKWSEGLAGRTPLELRPLSRARSRALALEILHKVRRVPDALLERIVDEAEGSPFFIEELINLFIDEGVIQVGEEAWSVNLDRLAGVRVPPTLAGILQTRLDSLPPAERLVLQRAAVVGRYFWDRLVAALTEDPDEALQVNACLASLRQRELVYHRERSSIAGCDEYVFTHALLRDAAYEAVLLKQRRSYHRQVAAWIEANTGERLEEHLALIAGHYAEGGQALLAADWYLRAGERAASQASPQEARRLFDLALRLIPADDSDRRWRALVGRDEVLGTMGERQARREDDAALLALAHASGDHGRLALAAFRIGSQFHDEGDYAAARQACDQALGEAQLAGDVRLQARILPLMVFILTGQGELQQAGSLVEQALEIATQTGDVNILARALNNLSKCYVDLGDLFRCVHLLQQQVEISQQQGNRLGEAFGLSNLGYYYLALGRYDLGRASLVRAVQTARSSGVRRALAYGLLNLGLADWRLEQPQAACASLEASLPELEALGDQMGLAARQFYLGLANEMVSDPAAAAHYRQALAAFESLDAAPQAVEARAGLLRVGLRQAEPAGLQEDAARVFTHLEQHGPQGLELPSLAYLSCARSFQALGDQPTLERLLQAGRSELLSRAGRISDAAWRQTFLEAIPEHGQLLNFDHRSDIRSRQTGEMP